MAFKYQFSSVQFSPSVVSDSLRPHESQHARPPCPSPTPGVQTYVHRVSDAIQPSHPLSSPSLPAPNPSQYSSFQNNPGNLVLAERGDRYIDIGSLLVHLGMFWNRLDIKNPVMMGQREHVKSELGWGWFVVDIFGPQRGWPSPVSLMRI